MMVNFLIPVAITMAPVLAIFLIGTLLEYYFTGEWLADTELLPMCIKTMVIVLGAIYVFFRFAVPVMRHGYTVLNIILIGTGAFLLFCEATAIRKILHADCFFYDLFRKAQFMAVVAVWLIVLGAVGKTDDIWSWFTKPTIVFIAVVTVFFIITLFQNWKQHQWYMESAICWDREYDLNPTKEFFDEACPWYRHNFYKIESFRKGRWPRYRYNYDVYCLTSENKPEVQLFGHLDSLDLDYIKSAGEKYKSIKAGLEQQNVKILYSGIDDESHRCQFTLEVDNHQHNLYSTDCPMNVVIWDYFPWEEANKITGFKIKNASEQSK